MKIIQAPRASAILYRLLVGKKETKTWLLPANICPIVPITFMKARVPFELVDISAMTLHMDLEQAEALIRKRPVGGLLYAHTYGDPQTPHDFFELVKSINPELTLIDDRCLCIPEFETPSSADVVLYSTGYAKIVELGSGGYAFVKDATSCPNISLEFDPEQHPQIENSYKHAIQNGTRFNYVDSSWLQTDSALPEWNKYRQQVEDALKPSLAQRAAINKIYFSNLPEEICLPQNFQTWRFNIRLPYKEQTLKAIFAAGLFASSHYASLAGIMSDGSAPVAGALAGEVINLFNDHHFDEQMAEQTCEIILNAKSMGMVESL
ncbi:MAG: hypothetical protein ABI904_01690 [Chloroflexota bacterium]